MAYNIKKILLILLIKILNYFYINSESAFPQKTNYNEKLSKKLLYLAAGAYANSPKECIQKLLFILYFKLIKINF